MTEEKKEKQKDKYILKEVVTETGTAIGVDGSDEIFSDKGLLVEILNKLDRIEKAVA
jgi:hypothetical protein